MCSRLGFVHQNNMGLKIKLGVELGLGIKIEGCNESWEVNKCLMDASIITNIESGTETMGMELMGLYPLSYTLLS